tara:strand:+ start:241 stop:1407 length:1167 start_codon:yes stop_codon:yes gene_type:complete
MDFMFQIISAAQKEYSFSEYFNMASNQWGSFSFGSSIQKYTLYVLIGIVVFFLIRIAAKAIRSASGIKEVTDTPYRLRKLSTRIEHFKEIVSSKTVFTYRIFDKEKKDVPWSEGKFLSLDRKKNLIVVLYETTGKPEEYINKILEIKYPVDKNNGLFKSPILKYMSSKKTSKNVLIRMYEIKLPLLVKLEPKRKDIRFKVSGDYPIRVYLLVDKLDIPVAANCIDFSGGGVFIELEDAKAGCLDYLMKKDKIITEKEFDAEQVKKLNFYKILSQPELEFGEAREAKKKVEHHLGEYTDSIEMANDFISSLKKDDTVKLFFILPELPLMEEAKEELLSLDNRTIMCDALVGKTTGDEESEKQQLTLQFLEIDDMVRDTIHQYGLESWRE